MDEIKEIDTIDIKRKPKITCIERKYKITDSKASYIITAKRELDENVTKRLLHEDMELKTFLANYEIASIPHKKFIIEKHKIDHKVEKHKMEKHIKMPKIRDITKIRKDTMERRELFDSLDLPEEFTTTDYEIALEKKGVKVTNPVMANDDFKYFVDMGKIERTGNRIKQGRAGYAFGYRKIEHKISDEKMVEHIQA